jgi:hypothetical protein
VTVEEQHTKCEKSYHYCFGDHRRNSKFIFWWEGANSQKINSESGQWQDKLSTHDETTHKNVLKLTTLSEILFRNEFAYSCGILYKSLHF